MAKGSANIAPLLAVAALAAGGLYVARHGLDAFGPHVQQSVAELRLRLTGIHPETDGAVMADIEVLNPSSVPFHVQSIIGDFLYQGKRVGTVKMFGDQVIRPNDQGNLAVSVRVLPNAAAVWRHRGAAVQFSGKININNHLLPLTMAYTI